MSTSCHVAFDLGAESGRTLLGRLHDGVLDVREVNRFPNRTATVNGHLYWNAIQLLEEMKAGLASCFLDGEGKPQSIGIDTWGVDFALLDRNGDLLGMPYAYRDAGRQAAVAKFLAKMPRERLHALTGLQILFVNSVYQLEALAGSSAPVLDVAKHLLFMPDLFNYLLTGVRKTEFSFATTTQLFNPSTRGWEPEIFRALGVPMDLMQEIVPPGTILGPLLGQVAEELAVPQIPVVAVASHDTGSAVAAVPAEGDDWAFISSGTWSIMGVLTDAPVINDVTLEGNFSNEGASSGDIRLLRNINALWLIQQCRKAWSAQRPIGYGDITAMAQDAEPFVAFVDPDSPDFASPADMPEAIRGYCRKTGQRVPESDALVARVALESIALKYRWVLDRLRRLVPRPINRVHAMGGGIQNKLLCQFSADAMGIPVMAGPLEATAIGNLLVQAKALGHVGSDEEIRAIVRRSINIERYEPRECAVWDAAYSRFLGVAGQ